MPIRPRCGTQAGSSSPTAPVQPRAVRPWYVGCCQVEPESTEYLRRAIGGVALPDAPKVHAHSLPLQKRPAGAIVNLQIAIVDERQALEHLAAIGNRIVLVLIVELPQTGQQR